MKDDLDIAISLSRKYTSIILPHNNDDMVINVQCNNREIKRVMIDPGKLIDVLYWDAFDILRLDLDELRPFGGSLVGFSGEYV